MAATSTRRAMLTTSGSSVLAAAVVASTAAALPAPDPDAALMALRHDYDRTRAAWQASWPAHTEAEERYFELRHDGTDQNEEDLQQLSGLAAVLPSYEALENANHDALTAMAEMPARTLRGVIAKAEVSAIESNMVPDLLASLVADLVAMKPAA